jgi:hypothetical protein
MFSRKFVHCLILAVLFFVLSSPVAYRLVDKVFDTVLDVLLPHSESHHLAMAGCPTTLGLLLHAAVFGVLCYYVVHRG